MMSSDAKNTSGISNKLQLQTVPTVDVERLQCEGHMHRALTTIGRRANDADKFPVSIFPRKSISISPSAGPRRSSTAYYGLDAVAAFRKKDIQKGSIIRA